MGAFKVHLDHAAIHRMLTGQFAPLVNEVAEAVGETTRHMIPEIAVGFAGAGDQVTVADSVEVTPWTTDRARPSVRIAHPAGEAIQHRYGVLTRAAAQHGLEVKEQE